MSSTANRVIKNTGYLYAKMGITMFISLYTTRLILNSLGASDFGIFNIVGGAIAMLGFLNGAMASATQRFMSFSEGEGDKEKQKSIFNVSIVLHFAISLLVGVVLLLAGYFFFNGILNIPDGRINAAKVVYVSLIVSTMFTVMTVPYDAAMNAHENMKYYAAVGILESLLKLAVAFICVFTSEDKLIVYGVLMACIPLVSLTIMRIYCHRHYEECIFNVRKHWDKGLMREMTGFAGWNFANTAVIMVSAQGQGIILNHFFGTILNAAHGISNQVNGQLQILSSNMLKAINPILGKSAGAKDEELLIKTTLLGAKYSTALYLLVAIPFFFEAPYILKIWLKEIPNWTIIFIRLQLIKSFIEFQFGTFPTAISATGKIRNYTIWSCVFNFFQLPVMYLLFNAGMPPYFMYVTSIVFGNILVYIAAVLFVKKMVGISITQYVKKVSLPLYGTLALSIVILYVIEQITQINTILKLFIFILFAIITFSIIFILVGCSQQEKHIFNTIKEKILNKIYQKA